MHALPPDSPAARALAHVARRCHGSPAQANWRVTLNFHPDRLVNGQPILVAMAADGVYRSQFETGTSNGGLTARPGGDRWYWESRIFGRAYDHAAPAERPKYGALDPLALAEGAAPRFGSAHLRLSAGVLQRTTFCYPDSVHLPEHFGLADRMDLVERLAADVRSGRGDPLDHYIEAHVHGPLVLSRDVEAIVLDPSFRGTDVEAQARSLPWAVHWHAGFAADADMLHRHADYRGPAIAALAAGLAGPGQLTPAALGAVARSGRHDPQDLKKVWHCLARFGNRNAHPGFR